MTNKKFDGLNMKSKMTIDDIRFRDMIDNDKMQMIIISEVIKRITLLSPEGIKSVAEAVQESCKKVIIIMPENIRKEQSINGEAL